MNMNIKEVILLTGKEKHVPIIALSTVKRRILYRPKPFDSRARVKKVGNNMLAFIPFSSSTLYRITKRCIKCKYYHSKIIKGYGTIKEKESDCNKKFPLSCPFRTILLT